MEENNLIADAKEVVAIAMLHSYNPQIAQSYPQVKLEMFDMIHCLQWPANFDALHPTVK